MGGNQDMVWNSSEEEGRVKMLGIGKDEAMKI